jgi:steroid delta-isomerase-like uncharacterized protein
MGQPVDAVFFRDFVKRWAELVNDGDIDALIDTSADDIVFIDPSFPEPFRGKDAFRSLLENVFGAFPDLGYEPVGEPLLTPDGSVAAIRVHFTGTMLGRLDPPGFAPTGGPIDFMAVELFEFEGERPRHVELVFDVLALGTQIGAAPAPGSVGERLGLLLQRAQARSARRRQRR